MGVGGMGGMGAKRADKSYALGKRPATGSEMVVDQ
jgi:hypothetical protein